MTAGMTGHPDPQFLEQLRRTMATSTHHHFALDAIGYVDTEAGHRLGRWLLRYPVDYLRGSRDPDVRFRDYHNHVVHADDGFWGGAPRVAHVWYDRLLRRLGDRRYRDAAYAAGVLTHYVSDPLMPLHTGDGPVAAVLHRPIEWSICRAYDQLLGRWKSDPDRRVGRLGHGPAFLGEAILRGAQIASHRRDVLLDDYDLNAARRDPAAGLGPRAATAIAEMIGLSVTTLARVFERVAGDAESLTGRPIEGNSLAGVKLIARWASPIRRRRRRYRLHCQDRWIAKLVAALAAGQPPGAWESGEVRVVRLVRQIHRRERLRRRVVQSPPLRLFAPQDRGTRRRAA